MFSGRIKFRGIPGILEFHIVRILLQPPVIFLQSCIIIRNISALLQISVCIETRYTRVVHFAHFAQTCYFRGDTNASAVAKKQFRKHQRRRFVTVCQHKYAIEIGTVAETAAHCAGTGGIPNWT